MGLLQWHKVCKLGGDELHRPPVVALSESTEYYIFSNTEDVGLHSIQSCTDVFHFRDNLSINVAF